MKVKLLGDRDTFIPMDITGEPYALEWEGELNEAQLLWLLKQFPNCEMVPLKDWNQETPEVIGIEVALEGYDMGEY